jgi:hypothetical protein
VIRRLWFDLPQALRLAEQTADGATSDAEPHSPPAPWLVLDANNARLWFTPLNAPRPRSPHLAAVHDDGDQPDRPQTWPLYRQPLDERDTEDMTVLDRLRAAAADGHRWLTVDAAIPARVSTEAVYETGTVPGRARWVPAYVQVGDLGPYPAQIASGYHWQHGVIPRFDRQVVAHIAADTQARALRTPNRAAEQVIVDGAEGNLEVFLVRLPDIVANQDGARLLPIGAKVELEKVAADPDGWYPVAACRWRWDAVLPPMRLAPIIDSDGAWVPVFEPEGPDGDSRCTVCGATGYDIAHHEVPSMAGYDMDATTRCRICRSAESTGPVYGWTSQRAIWPPASGQPNPVAGQHPHSR